MLERRPRATSTTAAAVLMVLVCIPFIFNAFPLFELMGDPASADPELRHGLIMTGNPAGEAATRTFAIFGAIVTLGLCALSFVLAVGVFQRRQSSLHAAAVTFTVLALIALASSATGLMARPPAENAKLGLLVGLVDAGIVICLLLGSTQDDIEQAEVIRARRRHEKEDARAAKRRESRAAR